MHELSICQSLVDQVITLADVHHAVSVESIALKIGPLSGVEPALLEQSFPFASAGTIASNARLEISKQEVRVYCDRCDAETIVPANQLICGVCGNWKTRLISGDEMLLVSVEMNAVGDE